MDTHKQSTPKDHSQHMGQKKDNYVQHGTMDHSANKAEDYSAHNAHQGHARSHEDHSAGGRRVGQLGHPLVTCGGCSAHVHQHNRRRHQRAFLFRNNYTALEYGTKVTTN